MQLSGWGRYPTAIAKIIEPVSQKSAQSHFLNKTLGYPIIARGSGRSYGDSALAAYVLNTRFLDNFISLNTAKSTVTCGSGVQLKDMLNLVIPAGFFPPVLPGTKYVTVGGAIAADIHGKNHHQEGSFCQHLVSFDLLLANGEIIQCSRSKQEDLFRATCGGMGLTGVILNATINLKKVASVFINQKTRVARNLSECMDIFDASEECEYSVAWLDAQAQGEHRGRSLIHTGNHSKKGGCQPVLRREQYIPLIASSKLLNRYSIKLFNELLYQSKVIRRKSKQVSYESYFFPLDGIKNWNLIYGSKGFIQYQFVVPIDCALEAITVVLERISDSGTAPTLSVLKKFVTGNDNYLSFPRAGYTLSMDFKRDAKLLRLLDELDEIVLSFGGRQYLAKDARMSERVFKESYENWEKFVAVKTKYDPENIFSSQQSKRLGLTN